MNRFIVWTQLYGVAIVFGISLAMAHPVHTSALAYTNEVKNTAGRDAEEAKKAQLQKTYGKLPLYFIQNDGQVNGKVQFYEKASGHGTFFTKEGVYLTLTRKTENKNVEDNTLRPTSMKTPLPMEKRDKVGGETTSDIVKLTFLNANSNPKIIAEEKQKGIVNYFIGNDPKKWKTNVSTYQAVVYKEIYPGIDLKFYGNNRQMEYDIIVRPGAEPSKISLAYEGIEGLRVTDEGHLEIGLKGGTILQKKPLVYQYIDGRRVYVAGTFKVQPRANRHSKSLAYGFDLASYDKTHPLIIDPTLVYSTYLGGSNDELGADIAVDATGNAYVTGPTDSTDFPTVSPLQATYSGGGQDAFVSKLNAAGTALVYSTYLGGSGWDFAGGIAVDASGNAYVTGFTASTDFPMASPLQGSNAGYDDAFVAKLSAAGSALLYSTYLGGSSYDEASDIAVDGSGNAYVMGLSTCSLDFPTTPGAFQTTYGGACVAFVSKLNAAGSALVYSTYLGGSTDELGTGIAVDGSGNAYVMGFTASIDFPTTPGAYQTTYGGGICPILPFNPNNPCFDIYVAKLNAAGSALLYSTYLGGSGDDVGSVIAVDTTGNAYVTGSTDSTDFPTVNPLQATYSGGGQDAFVSKLNAAGTALVYSTYLGGSGSDWGYGIAVDTTGNAYMTGGTSSTDFPTVNPLQATYSGGGDAYVAKLNSAGSALVYSTYLGGSGYDFGYGITVAAGNAYMTGITDSTDFPTVNPLQAAYSGGGQDAFVAKIEEPADQPDLIMTNVTPNAATVNAGDIISVTDTVMNQGASSGAFRIGYHLSTDNIYGNADDVVISTIRVVESLEAGASNTATTNLSIPSTAPGADFYLCTMADSVNQVDEGGNEGNNTLCSSTVVTVPLPDLIISAISTSATTVTKGTKFYVSFKITNQGGSNAGAFVTRFQLSTDTNYGGVDDIPITQSLSLSSLGVGKSFSKLFPLVVPRTTPSGTYYACGMTDEGSAVTELDETNNTNCTGTMITVP